mgnify:CR=1 FL=1|jgi:hypothetical protein
MQQNVARPLCDFPSITPVPAAGSQRPALLLVASRPAPVARRRPRTVFSFQFLDRSYRPFRVR